MPAARIPSRARELVGFNPLLIGASVHTTGLMRSRQQYVLVSIPYSSEPGEGLGSKEQGVRIDADVGGVAAGSPKVYHPKNVYTTWKATTPTASLPSASGWPGLALTVCLYRDPITEHDPTLVLLGHEPTGVYHEPALRPSQSPVPSPSALCLPSPLPRNHGQNRPPYFLIDRERSAGAGGWRLAAWPRLTVSAHIGGRVANNTVRIRTNRTVSAINSLAYNHDMTLPLVR